MDGKQTGADDVLIERDQVYDAGLGLAWDIYRPARQNGKLPVVLLIHGGGFVHGSRTMMTGAATAVAKRGFIAIAPQYRLAGEADWPAAIDDVRRAVAAVGANAAKLNADGAGVFCMGYSAGAFLSLLAGALEPKAVRAVGAFFSPDQLDASRRAVLKLTAEVASKFSPVTNAGRLPPTILFCGDDDPMTPDAMTRNIHAAIKAAGGVVDLRLYAGLTHEFVLLPGMTEVTVADALGFFRRTVLDKTAFDIELKKLNAQWTTILAGAPAD